MAFTIGPVACRVSRSDFGVLSNSTIQPELTNTWDSVCDDAGNGFETLDDWRMVNLFEKTLVHLGPTSDTERSHTTTFLTISKPFFTKSKKPMMNFQAQGIEFQSIRKSGCY